MCIRDSLELAQRALVLREAIKLRRGGVVLLRVRELALARRRGRGGRGRRCGARGATSERKRQRDDAPSCTREPHDGPQGLRLATALSIPVSYTHLTLPTSDLV